MLYVNGEKIGDRLMDPGLTAALGVDAAVSLAGSGPPLSLALAPTCTVKGGATLWKNCSAWSFATGHLSNHAQARLLHESPAVCD